MAQDDEGFLSRWSRRKQAQRSGQPVADQPLDPVQPIAPPSRVQGASPATVTTPVADGPVAEPPPEAPPPTLQEAEQLTPESDFRRFVGSDVPSEVRNAAVKKLFADPHFNVMDGLDIYIDDYSLPSPLSKVEMAKMVGAQFLKLVDDPEEPKKTEASAPQAPDTGAVAQTSGDAPTPSHDDHADLQLQPDPAPGRQDPGRGAG
ncbi:MAG: DUF3306 domain-containing protein [Hydrogenophaga sp.]|uniref:DUF3306 domain-containing protein n=1 Tax=Hydrogenophaga sp. TaxID=1904254 RepID=UPI001DC25DA0|nr:DUF3306 domain-containing protein [Hydrogenophaga sp.]MBX3609250.1 DUF3306 domain-containing protein [Hydrogenophaga sp.]